MGHFAMKKIKEPPNNKFRFIVLAAFTTFALSAVVIYDPRYNWHNQQRISQLTLITLCLLCLLAKNKEIQTHSPKLISIIFSLGLLSCSLSTHSTWALKEWALYLGLFSLALGTYHLARKNRKIHEDASHIALIIGFLLAAQFTIYYASAYISKIQNLDPSLLFPGFDNPRFLAQFQTILIPLLASFYSSRKAGSAILKRTILATLSIHWCIAYTLGGRGFFAAIFLSNLYAILFFKFSTNPTKIQLKTATLGLIIYYCLFKLPLLISGNVSTENWGYSPLRTDLTGRDALWRLAWQNGISHPIFGIGPMGLASSPNTIAAHPHQVILQWLAEWGAPATIAICILILNAGYHYKTGLHKRTPEDQEKGIVIALLGAIALAQVDGVAVMPYIQTWLMLLAGLLMAKHFDKSENSPPQKANYLIALYMAIALAIIMKIIFIEAPEVPSSEEYYYKTHIDGTKPRFWSQGWIK